MLIKFGKTSYYLGESIPAEINYMNSTSEKILVENPAKSLDINLHMLDSASGEGFNYTLGQTETLVIDKASDRYVTTVPKKELVTIPPDSGISFKSDLNERLYLRPGNFICYLTEGEKESNRVALAVHYQRESVIPLVQVARDPNMIYGRREWAGDWLRKLYPGFQLDLPYDEDTPDVRKEKEKQISLKVAEFLSWWQENRNNPQMDTLLLQAESL